MSDRGVKKVKNAFDKVDDVLGFDTRGTVKGVEKISKITITLSIKNNIIYMICRCTGDHIKYNLMYY